LQNTPKSLRLQIALFGRTNVGKSSFLNMITKQDVSMTSSVPGTTTDVVEKAIELLPIGPVTFLDTAGIDDISILSDKRIERTKKIFDRADIAILVIETNIWTENESQLAEELKEKKIPFIIAVNKIDLEIPKDDFIDSLKIYSKHIVRSTILDPANLEKYINDVKHHILEILPEEYTNPIPLVGDLLPAGGLCVLITPIDLQAPKGRLILPQVQAIRDILDNDAVTMVVKEREYAHALTLLKEPPNLVICDSQVVMKMVADTPKNIKCTTFSILMSRFKGDLNEEAKGVAAIDKLKSGDKILIAEACSHHALEDDIGKVKIPRWLRQYVGIDIQIDFSTGRDFPDNIKEYKVIIHCGGCMLTRNEKLVRIQKAKIAGVPITNYGITISLIQGVLERVLSPFPSALESYLSSKD
jgi:[FeFe] hydrogenase H-cluster maturation GTPase HydF